MPDVAMSRSAKAAVRVLRKHKAPHELVSLFQELVATNVQCGFGASVRALMIDACRRFNFTAPFSMDGRQRYFRSRLLNSDDPNYSTDCRSSHTEDIDLRGEQSYRRGVDQGFAEAIRNLEKGASLSELKKRQEAIHAWRVRPLQIVGSFPGSGENFEECFVVPRGTLSPRVRYKVFERDGFRCQICGHSQADGVTLHADHRKSLADGGSDELENLQTLCSDCNLGKSSDSMN